MGAVLLPWAGIEGLAIAMMRELCIGVAMCSGESRHDIKGKVNVGEGRVGVDFSGV